MTKESGELGTEELERNMRPGRARDAGCIGAIAITVLLVCNSGGLVTWTQALPSNATNAWISERASNWHEAMTRLGPAAVFDRLRERFKPD